MAEVNVPGDGNVQVSQDDTIKDAAGQVFSASHQQSVKDHVVSSGSMTEDGEASEDVAGVFQKASNALSSFFGVGASQAQGDKFSVDNATGEEYSPKEEVTNVEEEEPKKDDLERKDSGETLRTQPAPSQYFKSDESMVENDQHTEESADLQKPISDSSSAKNESSEDDSEPKDVSENLKHKNDVSQEDDGHAIGAVLDDPAGSESQPKDDDAKTTNSSEQEPLQRDGPPKVDDSKEGSSETKDASESPKHEDDIPQEQKSHAIGALPEESVSSKSAPSHNEFESKDSSEQGPLHQHQPVNEENSRNEPLKAEERVAVEKQVEANAMRDEPESMDDKAPQKVEVKEDGVSPKDVDNLKEDGDSGAKAQPSLAEQEKPLNDDFGNDAHSPVDREEIKTPSFEQSNEPEDEAESKVGSVSENESSSEFEESEPKDDETVNQESDSKDEFVPKASKNEFSEESKAEAEFEKTIDSEDSVSPKDIGKIQDDGDADINTQQSTMDGEDFQPPRKTIVHFDDDTKGPAERTGQSEEDKVEKSILDGKTKEETLQASSDVEAFKGEIAAPLDNDSENKAKAENEDTSSNNAETEPTSREEEDVSPKAVNEEENGPPKPDIDAATEPTEDRDCKAESQRPIESENDEPKADDQDSTARPETSAAEDSAPKDIGELKWDGNASANSQPDRTEPEPLKIANEFKENSEILVEKESESTDKKASEEHEAEGNPATPAQDSKPIEDGSNPENDDTGLKKGIDTQEKDVPEVSNEEASEEVPESVIPGEDGSKADTVEDDISKEDADNRRPKNSAEQDSSLTKDTESNDDGSKPSIEPKGDENPKVDLPGRPKLGNDTEQSSQGSEDVGKDYLFGGLDSETVDKAEEKRGVEPSRPEAQESPAEEASAPPAQNPDVFKGSLLDDAESPQAKEVEKFEQPSEVKENQKSSKESSEPSQTKQQIEPSMPTPLATISNNATEAIASTYKNLLDTATMDGKEISGSVAKGTKDNAPETGKKYTTS